jgi:hypothetical protein
MAEITSAIIAHCKNNATITAAFSTRIYGNKIPDIPDGSVQVFPYARMREITTGNQYHHGGTSGRVVLVQVDVFDDDESGANTNSELIRSAFDGYKGMIGSTINAGIVKSRRVSQEWMSEDRKFQRIIEISVSTND